MDYTALDFQQARIKQVLFKSQLRSILYGVRPADAALFDPARNSLSQWISKVISPAYEAHAAVPELARVVRRLLALGQRLVTDYTEGRIEEARVGLGEVDKLSDYITALFTTLETGALTLPRQPT